MRRFCSDAIWFARFCSSVSTTLGSGGCEAAGLGAGGASDTEEPPWAKSGASGGIGGMVDGTLAMSRLTAEADAPPKAPACPEDWVPDAGAWLIGGDGRFVTEAEVDADDRLRPAAALTVGLLAPEAAVPLLVVLRFFADGAKSALSSLAGNWRSKPFTPGAGVALVLACG